ncbi:MAG: glycosyltransferase family 1 protein, partial [Bacteroidota bacterium]
KSEKRKAKSEKRKAKSEKRKTKNEKPFVLKLLVDIYKTKDLYSGLGQYSLYFANELLKFCPSSIRPAFLIPPGLHLPRYPEADWIRAGFWQRYIPRFSPTADIWHSLHPFPSHLPHPSSKLILTVHDLNFLIDKTPAKAARYLKKLQENVNRAAVVTVISDYTGKVLKEHIDTGSKQVFTIHDGVALEKRPDAEKPGWMPGSPFFFSLSVFKESKNIHTLIPLMEHFPDHALVLAGNNRSSYGERIREMIKASGNNNNIILPGPVNEDEKYWLYRNCRAFLFPSLAEGFGLPVIEAMLAGKQVFLSRSASLPEVGGVIAFYWDSFDASEMAAVLRNGIELRENDPVGSAKVTMEYASRFNWENCIMKFLELYQTILA